MTGTAKKSPFFEKAATIIVDKRNLIFFLYICALIFSLFSRNWVNVCDDLTDYLPESTETKLGLTIMDDELTTFGTARVMLSNVTYDTALRLTSQIEEINGVSSAKLGDHEPDDMAADYADETPEDMAEYYTGSCALISVTFGGESEDEVSISAMQQIKTLLQSYDVCIDSEVGNSINDTLGGEIAIVMIIVVIVIVLMLTLTSHSYAEVPVLLLTFGSAALLNMGTNFVFGEISFVSNSVTVVLQLALAIDYAIIFLRRFTEERARFEDREACIHALAYSIPAITASSLTTIGGLLAMMFMQYGIGADMGKVLIKAICFSMLSVFTLMPGLLMLFSKALIRTQHRVFVPSIDKWGKFVVKTRYIGAPVFILCVAASLWLSVQCPFGYGYSLLTTSRQSEQQIAAEKTDDTFGAQNVMALLIPAGDYESEAKLLDRLDSYDEVDYVMGLANIEVKDGYDYALADSLTPRQFSELMDMSYGEVCLLYSAYTADEKANIGPIVGGIDDYSVPLMDMLLYVYDFKEDGYVKLDAEDEADIDDAYEQITKAQTQMLGENYSRMVISLNLPEEDEKTFSFLDTIRKEAERYYDGGSVYLVGDSTSDKDLSDTFSQDNLVISILSVLFVMLVLLFTFQSVGLPVLLVLVIQGSIWINFSIPTLTNSYVFFMSYLIVTAIQMGANIDYAIVISSRYTEMKAAGLPPRQAIIKALDLAFPTVLTSGTILTVAALLISKISTQPAIAGLGECLCRGTLISMFLVMFILPQLLLLGDLLVAKTSFKIKIPEHKKTISGSVYVNGRVRGQISGTIDANVCGVIRGDISADMTTGSYNELPEAQNDETNK